MNPTLLTNLYLLMLNPEKGYYHAYASSFKYGLLGAAVMDLYRNGCIKINDQHIELKSCTPPDLPMYKRILKKAPVDKPIKIYSLLIRLGSVFPTFKKELIYYLIENGQIEPVRKKFLFIPYYRYYHKSDKDRNGLINRLRQILLYGQQPVNFDDFCLLALVHTCELYKALSVKKEERKRMRTTAKALLQSINNDNDKGQGHDIAQIIKAIKSAILAANASRVAAGAG